MIRRLLIAASLAGLMAGCAPTPRPVSATEDAARVAAWWHRKEPPRWHYVRHHEVAQKRVPACDLTGFKAGCETYGGSGIRSCPATETPREGQCSAQAVWR